MQTKLILSAEQLKKLPLSAKLSGVNQKAAEKFGKEIHVEVSVNDPAKLVKLGTYLATITDEEVASYDKQLADKKKTA